MYVMYMYIVEHRYRISGGLGPVHFCTGHLTPVPESECEPDLSRRVEVSRIDHEVDDAARQTQCAASLSFHQRQY